MNKKQTNKLINRILIAIFVLMPSIMFAPPIPPGPGGTSPVTPIDGGIWFLVFAGVSFGVYKFLNIKKQLV